MQTPSKTLIVFYSWQSDTPSNLNRSFLEKALGTAIERLHADVTLEPVLRNAAVQIDKDTKGVGGSPPITQTILDKIENCAAFVADLTFVGESLPSVRTPTKHRLLPNPNVLIEYGYALHCHGHGRMITVMNTAFGDCNQNTLPFDLRHLRWPIIYNLQTPDLPEKKAIFDQLVSKLTEALKLIFATQAQSRAALETERLSLSAKLTKYQDALSAGNPNTQYILDEFLDRFLDEIARHRIRPDGKEPFDETLVESLKELLPLRDYFLELCNAWIRTNDAALFVPKVVKVLEQVRILGERPDNAASWHDNYGDNFGFLAHELFLSIVAILLRHRAFKLLVELFSTQFVLPDPDNSRRSESGPFTVFYDYSEVLEERNARLAERKISPQGLLLKHRATSPHVPFVWLQQADLISVVSYLLVHPNEHMWWPHTLLYDHRIRANFETFQRAESLGFYNQIAPLWGGFSPEEFRRQFAASITDGAGSRLHADHPRPDWSGWLNLEKLGTKL